AVLAEALAPRARAFFEEDESAAMLLRRVELLHRHLVDQQNPEWPGMEDATLEQLLREACAGRRSVAELKTTPLANIVRGALPYPLDRMLESEAPERIEVPTGNRIALDYAQDPPVLAVRLQELFGLADTPRIARGRLPVMLHLLGPNYRPVQVTQDLASFWKNTYPQVRKDVRARYPKHSWPEDPLTALPQAKGSRRK